MFGSSSFTLIFEVYHGFQHLLTSVYPCSCMQFVGELSTGLLNSKENDACAHLDSAQLLLGTGIHNFKDIWVDARAYPNAHCFY